MEHIPEILAEAGLTGEPEEAMVQHVWRLYLMTGLNHRERRPRHLFRLLPSPPRCRYCYAPFRGPGGAIVRSLYGRWQSNLNPTLCNVCERFASKYQGGTEIELSLLFADVRGSTTIAERMSPLDFSKLINRFYDVATRVMVQTDAMIDKLTGDQVAGMYAPGLAGQQHARRALEGAKELLRATGHGRPEGPWIPLGAGVHTGIAFVGSIRSETGINDITVLGDTANTAARLASSAGQGEILISDAAYQAAGLDLGALEQRELELKGKSERVAVRVLTL